MNKENIGDFMQRLERLPPNTRRIGLLLKELYKAFISIYQIKCTNQPEEDKLIGMLNSALEDQFGRTTAIRLTTIRRQPLCWQIQFQQQWDSETVSYLQNSTDNIITVIETTKESNLSDTPSVEMQSIEEESTMDLSEEVTVLPESPPIPSNNPNKQQLYFTPMPTTYQCKGLNNEKYSKFVKQYWGLEIKDRDENIRGIPEYHIMELNYRSPICTGIPPNKSTRCTHCKSLFTLVKNKFYSSGYNTDSNPNTVYVAPQTQEFIHNLENTVASLQEELKKSTSLQQHKEALDELKLKVLLPVEDSYYLAHLSTNF